MAANNPIEVKEAGERAMVAIYGGDAESLDELRYKKYLKKVASQNEAVQPSTLPPTSAAAKLSLGRILLTPLLRTH